jgi:hypothetical protein
MFGITLNTGIWAWAVAHIYHLPAEKLSAFVTLSTHAMYTNAIIIVFMITGRLVWEWSNASSAVTTVATTIEKKIAETDYKGPTRSSHYGDA